MPKKKKKKGDETNRRARRRQLWRWREVRTDVHHRPLKYAKNTSAQEEVEKLAHPKRPLRQRVGVVLSYVGMAADRPLLHHPLLLDGRLLAATPH